jgi:thiamine-phosphate pyrophosphorylase
MRKALSCPVRGVYAITPNGVDTQLLVHRTEIVLAAGVAVLQYRNKTATNERRLEQASALRVLCRRYATPLIINDDLSLAEAVDADGVHLGEHDTCPGEARARLGPDAIVGASCYDDLSRAEQAVSAGASYLAFGAFHPTRTKQNVRRAGPDLLRAAKRFGLPLVAIGGIKPDNASLLISAGADLIAVVSGIYETPDPAAAVRAYLSSFDSALPTDPAP